MNAETEALLHNIRSSIIGVDRQLDTPFGSRRLIYTDYTASGRSLSFIEDYIRANVLPLYANTHTEASGTGLQTNRFREEARAILHASTGCGEEDVVIFCGSGATGAINKLVDVLNLRLPADLDARYKLRDHIPAGERPVVFVGPYEHNANMLPWRESIAELRVIDEDENGLIDLNQLESELFAVQGRPLVIGSFSAASNVTGLRTDVWAVAELLHRYGALSFWDYASAGPYLPIEMNRPGGGPNAYKDAVFLSPHKFIGGPGSPGVLLAKKHLFKNRVPSTPSGGAPSWLGSEHRYLQEIAEREEGGTPAIVESIRAGLAFRLKATVGEPTIAEREHDFTRRAIAAWSAHPNLVILGDTEQPRLSILSFMIRHGSLFLHYNYVTVLLNDLFGIQARGGCSCAGLYGHRLLGIGREMAERVEREVMRDCSVIRPGWTRLGFNFFISEAEFDFIVRAVLLIAEHGWRLLPLYRYDPGSGNWQHRGGPVKSSIRRLSDAPFTPGPPPPPPQPVDETDLERTLAEAERIFASAAVAEAPEPVEESEETRRLRWFPSPAEAGEQLATGLPPIRAHELVFRLADPEQTRRATARATARFHPTVDRAARVLVIRHEDWKTYLMRAASRRKYKNLGNFELVARRDRVAFEFIETPNGITPERPLEAYTHLIVLGGRMGAYEDDKHAFLKEECALIEAAMRRDMPILGICLGAQMLARVLGARVYPGAAGREIGWCPLSLTPAGCHDDLIGIFPAETVVFQWHDDSFDLPQGAVHLAQSPTYPHQAFRYGNQTWALQFHLEVTEEIIQAWARSDGEVNRANGLDMGALGRDTALYLPGYREKSLSFIQRFLLR